MSDKISEWVEQKFEGLTREQLREAGKALGATFAPNTSESTMRIKLCEIAGTMPNAGAPDPQPTAQTAPLNALFEPKPNLTASGTWGGRRHYVNVFPPGDNTESSPKYLRLFHDGEPRDFPYGVNIELSEPMYQNLCNAQRGDLDERKIKDEEGNLITIEHIPRTSPRFPYQYLGIVPGTENLPTSLTDYWRRQAKRTNNFASVPRRHLMAIRADLHGPVGRGFYKDLTDQDILFDILQFLGLEEDVAEAA